MNHPSDSNAVLPFLIEDYNLLVSASVCGLDLASVYTSLPEPELAFARIFEFYDGFWRTAHREREDLFLASPMPIEYRESVDRFKRDVVAFREYADDLLDEMSTLFSALDFSAGRVNHDPFLSRWKHFALVLFKHASYKRLFLPSIATFLGLSTDPQRSFREAEAVRQNAGWRETVYLIQREVNGAAARSPEISTRLH